MYNIYITELSACFIANATILFEISNTVSFSENLLDLFSNKGFMLPTNLHPFSLEKKDNNVMFMFMELTIAFNYTLHVTELNYQIKNTYIKRYRSFKQ